MNQIVFVVVDDYAEKVIGVFNEYEDAKNAALSEQDEKDYDGSEISITPVLVDRLNVNEDARGFYLEEQEVVDALQEEMDLALPYIEDEDDDEEDDDYDWDDEDDDEEEEIDPIEEMVYMMNGKRTISKANANMLLDMTAEAVLADDRIPADKKWDATQEIFLAFAKAHDLEAVDMRE